MRSCGKRASQTSTQRQNRQENARNDRQGHNVSRIHKPPNSLAPCPPPSRWSFLFFAFFVDWGLDSGLCACKAGPLLLESLLQSILLWLFWRWGLLNYVPKLASNCNTPDLCLQSS
jgi:hypothetical protein